MQINDNIKLIRELSRLTQREFSKLIKTNVSNLKTYENTDVKPKAYVILNVSKLAGVSAKDLETKKLQAEDVVLKIPKDEKVDKADGGPAGQSMQGIQSDYLDVIKMMITDLRKRSEEKESDLVALRSAVSKIDTIEFTVHGLKDKFSEYEPMILGLQEFVVDEIAGLKGLSSAKVRATLSSKVAAHRKKA